MRPWEKRKLEAADALDRAARPNYPPPKALVWLPIPTNYVIPILREAELLRFVTNGFRDNRREKGFSPLGGGWGSRPAPVQADYEAPEWALEILAACCKRPWAWASKLVRVLVAIDNDPELRDALETVRTATGLMPNATNEDIEKRIDALAIFIQGLAE